MKPSARPLWKCPKCHRRFANRNQWHSCGKFTVQEHFEGKKPEVVDLYKRFLAAIRECGSVTLAPTRTRIGIKTRMNFAAVVVRKQWLDAHIILSRRAEGGPFTRVESLTPTSHVHHIRITSLDQINEELKVWLREAYEVGR